MSRANQRLVEPKKWRDTTKNFCAPSRFQILSVATVGMTEETCEALHCCSSANGRSDTRSAGETARPMDQQISEAAPARLKCAGNR